VEILLVRQMFEIAAEGPGVTTSPRELDDTSRWREDWEVLARGLRSASPGTVLAFDEGITGEVVHRGPRGRATVRFRGAHPGGLLDAAERIGAVPLPPYIESARRRAGEGPDPEDRTRYQTVYARVPGAVAAPTAGLHFTDELLAAVTSAGHEIARLTLHVGPGTFRPVETDDPSDHRLDHERYEIPAATAAAVDRARAQGRPIVAVGTTAVRAIEAAAAAAEAAGSTTLPAGAASTDLFLLPGARFRVVTDLVTNFHLPRSTLLMLVAAFAGRERVLAAYQEAVRSGYRFYSYGDAMFIRPGPEEASV
jgi:S-adenosylmethionine:tRNA ribosyltransferase-isomerase